MKKLIFTSIFAGFALFAYSQTATYNEVTSKSIKGHIDTYITSRGESFSVGDTITLGTAFRNEQYDYIFQNAGIQVYPLNNTQSNSRVVIKNIKSMMGLSYVYTTKPQGLFYGLFITNFDAALANGEVISKIMTSDQALNELKKWKDKFDLGLVTNEEYSKKKEELSKLIK